MSLRIAGVSLFIFLLSFGIRFLSLSQSSFANGWDGYFYINQVQALFEEGQMHVADSSLVYPMLAALQLVVQDYVLSFRILACFLAALFSVSLFLLARKWSGNDRGALVIAGISLFSPHLTYFAAQYPKNLLGAMLFLWLLYSLDSRLKVLPFVLLVVNFFGHRITAVLSFISLLLHFLLGRLGRHVVFICIVFLVVFFVAGFLLPGVLSFFDVERLEGIFTYVPQFAPVSFMNTFGRELIPLAWRLEIILLTILFAVASYSCVQQLRQRMANHRLIVILSALLLLIFPFFRWSVDGLAFRFVLIFILLCPVVFIFFIDRLRNWYVISILFVPLVLLAFIPGAGYMPSKHDPPYQLYHNVSNRIALACDSTEVELVIAHKSLAEIVVFVTGIEAMSWIPEYQIDNEKLWRVVADVRDVQFNFYLLTEDRRFVSRLSPSYSFVREDVWRKFIQNVKADGNNELLDELATWRNPDQVRPVFLLQKKR